MVLEVHQALEEKGIDVRPMPDYPFKFILGDVFEVLQLYSFPVDFTCASPPCQAYSQTTSALRNKGKVYPDYIAATRDVLINTGKPFFIENVVGAPIRQDLFLCGTMFNLGVFRHRIFELNFPAVQPKHLAHDGKIGDGKYFTVLSGKGCFLKNGQDKGTLAEWKKAMKIDWIEIPEGKDLPSGHPLAEAIPPAYSKYIMLEYLKKHPTLDTFLYNK